MRILTTCIAVFLGACSVASAATVNETDLVGGFSSTLSTPTALASDTTDVTGRLSAGDFDFLHFTSLAAGAKTLTFTFDLANPSGLSGYQNAGGQVRIKDTQPGWAFDGDQLNASAGANSFDLFYDPFDASNAVVTQTLSYNLPSAFTGGSRYVSILPTFSSQTFSYGISLTGDTPLPSPVPIPAAGLMLLVALGGFAALRGRKSAVSAA
jgi:hypothetical protein